MNTTVRTWTCFENADAIMNVCCWWCHAQPGECCTYRKPSESEAHWPITVHQVRYVAFRKWAERTGFVPNHLIGENDKDLRRRAAQ